MKHLYGTATGASNLLEVSVSENHSSSCSTATLTCETFTNTVGSDITIDLGYSDSHGIVFKGYVKSIEHSIKEDVYSIVASDYLVRASDYFIVPETPTTAFTRQDIAAETLVGEVLSLAGITSYSSQSTYYTLAVNGSVAEVKLVSAYDYCNSIADLLAWHLWADRTGAINFKNRKPYVMLGTSSQPGDIADVPMAGKAVTQSTSMNIVYRVSEADLRNKIVVWGYNNITASASEASPYLPSGFYKTVLFSNEIIGSTEAAQMTADYNLAMLNRLNRDMTLTVLGDYALEARKTIRVYLPMFNIDEDMYIFSTTHNWSGSGYETSLVLKG